MSKPFSFEPITTRVGILFVTSILCGVAVLSAKQQVVHAQEQDRTAITPPFVSTCVRAGCSGELCVERSESNNASICIYKPEYSCYANARCERQSNGQCGFTMTSQLAACLDDPSASPSATPRPTRPPFPSPSVSPIPSPVANPAPISLGPTLPTQNINIYAVTLNGPTQTPVELDDTETLIEDGYGVIFQFHVTEGQEVEALAYQEDVEILGSYIRSKVYSPDGNELYPGEHDTRNIFTAEQTGFYNVVVRSFGGKQGTVLFQAFDPATDRIRVDVGYQNDLFKLIPPSPAGSTLIGRSFFQIRATFPANTYIFPDGTIEYFSKQAGEPIRVYPELTRASEGSTGSPEAVALGIGPGAGTPVLTLVPTNTSWFDKGYAYNLAMQQVFDSTGVSGTVSSHQFMSISFMGKQSDIDNDQKIDLRDYSMLSAEFMAHRTQYDADLNGDHQVNLLDYSIFVREYEEYQNNN